MQVGDKPVEVGLPMYDLCRRHGAIIATAHEHSYCRSHLMSDFETQTIASTNNTLNVGEGRSFTFVSGIAGWKLRPFEGNLYQNPWWAQTWSASVRPAKLRTVGSPSSDSGVRFLRRIMELMERCFVNLICMVC